MVEMIMLFIDFLYSLILNNSIHIYNKSNYFLSIGGLLILTHTNEKNSPISLFIIFSSITSGQGHWESMAQPTNKLLKNVSFVDSLTG